MIETPYTVLVEASDPTTLESVLDVFSKREATIHALDNDGSEASQTIIDPHDIVARDIGFYSVLGRVKPEGTELAYILANYNLGASKGPEGIALRGVKQFMSRIEHFGTAASPRDLGALVTDALHPIFLAEARLHHNRQRIAA